MKRSTFSRPIAHPVANLVATTALAFAVAGTALAADTGPATPADKLGPARALIADGKWTAAIDELKRVNDPASADWNNLMGYSHRKAKTPDVAAAERYYDEALRIEPKHRGALAYSGELYLMTGKLPQAEQRLAALDKACFLPCSEYTALKKSVEGYKAGGSKAVSMY
ncbi:tetratricopeptide repeat protein [uncultured Methylibium sp.]|uniref:tetratricopeptide repeat protein n=1 Tax=uncultured Methylibium sp. TaxID=381093 RepID=UPI0025FF842C|nr:tetratricopeptide repeat protein [uncultured Methylibium sp.]